jgi:hypothetical protein
MNASVCSVRAIHTCLAHKTVGETKRRGKRKEERRKRKEERGKRKEERGKKEKGKGQRKEDKGQAKEVARSDRFSSYLCPLSSALFPLVSPP